MKKWKLSNSATRDLEEIIRYTIETLGLAQGKKYDDQIINAIKELSKDPAKGRILNLTTNDYLKLHVARHLIIYKIEENFIIILRILHQKMDINRHI